MLRHGCEAGARWVLRIGFRNRFLEPAFLSQSANSVHVRWLGVEVGQASFGILATVLRGGETGEVLEEAGEVGGGVAVQ